VISFYRHGFAALGSGFDRLRAWAYRHPRWAKVLAVVAIDMFLVLVGNTYAYAGGNGGYAAPFLVGGDLEDSSGIPVANYVVLPLDRGDAFTPGKMFIAFIVDPMWTGHLGVIAMLLELFSFVLSFEWVGWIATPFAGLADLLESALGQINWIPFALAVSACVGGLTLLAGRVARGGTEMLVAACIAVMATGILANPVASLTAANGALDTAQEYGAGLAAAVVSDDISSADQSVDADDIITDAVTTQLVDIFIRIPAQTVTFGAVLSGGCEDQFDSTMSSSPPVTTGDNTVRDAVSNCDPAAKAYVENPNFGEVYTMAVIMGGSGSLFLFAIAIAIFFLITVVMFLIAALKTMINVYLAILPVSRYPLWKSLGDTFMGLVSVVAMTVIMAAYLKIVVSILEATNIFGIVMQMQIISLFMIVLIFLLWRFHRSAKRAGRSMAEQLGKLGMGPGSAKPDTTNRLLKMQTANDLARTAMHFLPRGGRSPARVAAANSAKQLSQAPANRPQALGLGSNSTHKALGRAAQAAHYTATTARIAKGAAGGVPGVAAAAALEVGGSVLRRSPRALEAGAAKSPDVRSRIVVDSAGVGHIERRTTVSAPPPPVRPQGALPPSPRSVQMRQLLAGPSKS
jgi:hypothetical protein